MLMIRLSRFGKKKKPIYRVVIAEKHKDPWGDQLEYLGTYNPMTEPATVALKMERIEHWLAQGAQCSPTVHNLLVNEGIIKDKKRKVVSDAKARTKRAEEEKKKKEEEAAAKKAEAEKKATEADTTAEEKKEDAPSSAEASEDKPGETVGEKTKTEDKPKEQTEETKNV